jgi:two-component system sensor histidine kinase NreB
LGILGMQERARLINGTFSVQSEVGKGTTVTVEVPE